MTIPFRSLRRQILRVRHKVPKYNIASGQPLSTLRPIWLLSSTFLATSQLGTSFWKCRGHRLEIRRYLEKRNQLPCRSVFDKSKLAGGNAAGIYATPWTWGCFAPGCKSGLCATVPFNHSYEVLETREKFLSSVWATVAQPLEQLGHLGLNNATAISKNLELGPRKTESADLRDVQSRISTVRSCCRG